MATPRSTLLCGFALTDERFLRPDARPNPLCAGPPIRPLVILAIMHPAPLFAGAAIQSSLPTHKLEDRFPAVTKRVLCVQNEAVELVLLRRLQRVPGARMRRLAVGAQITEVVVDHVRRQVLAL